MIRLFAATFTICLFAMPALAAPRTTPPHPLWNPPPLQNPQETCRIEKSVEQSSYTDSIRLTYTVMKGVPMNELFGTSDAALVSRIVGDWQTKIDDPNFKISDFNLGVGGIRLITNKKLWDTAFADILAELKKNPFDGWHYRDLYLTLDDQQHVALYDAFGELATLGFDLAFMGVSKRAARELLEDATPENNFPHNANCGLLDMWDLYTACVGDLPLQGTDYYTKTVFYARKAFQKGLLWQFSPFQYATNYVRPADSTMYILGSSSKCCNAANVCVGPSHETCTTCGSYCCMGCVPCY